MRTWLTRVGWRHLVACAAVLFSLFPIVFVVSAAVNPLGTLSSTTLIPRGASTANLRALLDDTGFVRWFGNSVLIAGLAAVLSLLLSALAAYAFSRMRFHGRRVGLLSLLLIQMFPQFLAIVAIFLIFTTVTDLWPAIGFNTPSGLILLYLGGALGVNTWLMKGFFDTVPKELDESATMDGATHAQVFFRILLPLVAPILAVTGLLAFIGTINEFVIANVFLTDTDSKTLAVGMYGLVAGERNNNFGIFCMGTLLTAVPTVAVFQFLQRYIVDGLTAGAVKGVIRLVAPHHDGSMVSTPAPGLGETVRVRVRVPVGARVLRVHVRSVPDGEPVFAAAVLERRRAGGDSWWAADVVVRNPVTPYRFLLETAAGPRWLTAAGVVAHDVPDATDFRLVAHAPPPAWATDAVVYQIFPDRFARSAAADGRDLPHWAVPCGWDTPVLGRDPLTSRQVYGGDLDGITAHLDHIAAVGANTVYLTPIFPAGSNHRYDATSFTEVDPLLGGGAALRRLSDAVHARGWRLLGDLTTNHTGDAHPWFTTAVSDVHAEERELYYFGENGDYESWFGVKSLPKLNWGSARLRRLFPAIVEGWLRPPYGLDGWRVDVANMTGRRGGDAYTREVAALLRGAAVAARPDALLMAEHAHDATGDLDAGGWHGTMNYAGFTRPVWSWLRGPGLDLPDFLGVPGTVPARDGRATVAAMTAFGALTSWRSATASWHLLGSHDTPRIRTVVGDAARHEVAAGLLMTLPGTPMIFAGDELGLRGDNGEHARTPMPWDDLGAWDAATLARYAALTRLRGSLAALRTGGLRWAYVGGDALAFLRETATEAVLVLARRDPGTALRLAGPPLGAGVWDNVYGGAPDLHPDAGGAVTLPGDGPTLQVWSLPSGAGTPLR